MVIGVNCPNYFWNCNCMKKVIQKNLNFLKKIDTGEQHEGREMMTESFLDELFLYDFMLKDIN